MEIVRQVVGILESENFSPIVETKEMNGICWKKIVWIDNRGDECWILDNNIAIDDVKIAWFQSSRSDNHIVKVYDRGDVFTWIPITYNPFFGCACLLLEWYKNHLIFIYQEKHKIYICSIKNSLVKHFSFHGEEIERRNDIISYDTYTAKSIDKVRLIRIPGLEELEPIEKRQAEEMGLLPKGINRPGNCLSLNYSEPI